MTLETIAPLSDDPAVSLPAQSPADRSGPRRRNAVPGPHLHHARDRHANRCFVHAEDGPPIIHIQSDVCDIVRCDLEHAHTPRVHSPNEFANLIESASPPDNFPLQKSIILPPLKNGTVACPSLTDIIAWAH
jgi:hypothetical protein